MYALHKITSLSEISLCIPSAFSQSLSEEYRREIGRMFTFDRLEPPVMINFELVARQVGSQQSRKWKKILL